MLTISAADEYITLYCIDNEDWLDGDAARKQRIINVAERHLTHKYPKLTIPDNAIYEFSNELSIAFNDANKLQQQGVASFSLTSVASMTFKDWAKSGLDAWISDTVLDLISEANDGVSLSRRTIRYTTL